MDILYGGLGISKLKFLIKKIEIKFPAKFFFNFRSSNPGSGSGSAIRKNAGSGSGSALNQCGSKPWLFQWKFEISNFLWMAPHFGCSFWRLPTWEAPIMVANRGIGRGRGGLGCPLAGFSPNTRNIVFGLVLLIYMTSSLCFWCYILLLTLRFFWYYCSHQVMVSSAV